MITTSARTPDYAAEEMTAVLDAPHFVFEWSSDPQDNPYLAFLATADRFVVTGESMSMLAEACATRRPVYIFDMDDGSHRAGVGGSSSRTVRFANALRYKALTHRLAQHLAPLRMRRDVGRLHRALIEAGRAVWLGQAFPDEDPPPLPDTREAARRVRELMEIPATS